MFRPHKTERNQVNIRTDMDQLQKREGCSSHWDNPFLSENNSQSQSASGRVADQNRSIQSYYLKPSEMNLLTKFGLSSDGLEELGHHPNDQLMPEKMSLLLQAIREHKMAHRAPSLPSKSAERETLCSAGGHGPTVKKKVIDYGHKSKYEGPLEGTAYNSSVAMDDNVKRFQTQQAASGPAASSNLRRNLKNPVEEPVRQVGSQDWIQHQKTALRTENCHRLLSQRPDWHPEVSSSSKRWESDREERYISRQRSASPRPKRSRCLSSSHSRLRTRSRSRSSERHRESRSRRPRHLLSHRSRSPQQSLKSSRQASSKERRSGNTSRSPERQRTRTPRSEKRHDEWKQTHSSSDCWKKRHSDVEQTKQGILRQRPSAGETGRQEQNCENPLSQGRTCDESEHSALASLTEKSVPQATALFQGGEAAGGRLHQGRGSVQLAAGAVDKSVVPSDLVSAVELVATQAVDSKEVSSRRAITSEDGQNPDPVHSVTGKAENKSVTKLVGTQKTEAALDSQEESYWEVIASEGGQSPKRVHSAVRKAENPSEAECEQPMKYDAASFKEQVQACPTLLECRERAKEINVLLEKSGDSKIYWDNSLLYREMYKEKYFVLPWMRQMIVPRAFREEIVKIAHEVVLSEHLGFKRTLDKITLVFSWPRVLQDVKRYFKNCDVCQNVRFDPERVKLPLEDFPVIQTPFSEIQISIQGPFTPTRSGETFVLAVIDRATCFPVAVPLRSVTSASVAKALLDFFAVYGFPRVMVSDRGTSFMRKLMQKLYDLAGVSQRLSTAYHSLSYGQVKNWGGTFSQMLKVFCEEHHGNWGEALPLLLSAYQDAQHPSLGDRSPNELIFGRNLPGVLDFLKSDWEGTYAPESSQSMPPCFANFQQALQKVQEIAEDSLLEAREKQASYDKTTKQRTLQKGDLVMLLSPEAVGRLDLHWTGPFVVEENCGNNKYNIRDPARGTLLVHINRLKKFIDREAQQMSIETWPEEDFDLPDLLGDVEQPDGLAQLPVNENLTGPQYEQLMGVFRDYAGVFSNRPGRTNQIVCDIDTGDAEPIKCNPHPVQGLMRARERVHIAKMLEMGIIEPCTSEWSSNLVIVAKKRLYEADPPQYHLCVDFRKLNKLCKTTQYPSPNTEEVLERLARANFITTFDLRSGHWQVPLSERAKKRTSFTCSVGQFCFNVLPFGISSASQEFQRLIDQVLQGVGCAVAYQDDIAVISSSWQEHLQHLRVVLRKIERAGLTIKPSTCQIANASVVYLGRWIGEGKISPHVAKVDAIVNWPTPETKIQIGRFLKVCTLYMSFIPNYNSLAAPLTGLYENKNVPVTIQWSNECQKAFETLKQSLAQAPILKPPDCTQPFVVCTDASPFGLGVVLMQKDQNDFLRPVLYLSRKLLPRERNYSPDEQGALAIVWGLNLLKTHLRGTHFQLETDNSPLAFIHSKEETNPRMMRWALSLQELSFDVTPNRCRDNDIADSLTWCYNDAE